MPGSKGNYLENRQLDHVLGGPDFVRPATVHIGLFLDSPGETGQAAAEVSGSNYSRAVVTNNATAWPPAINGSKTNGATISFPTPTGAWGPITAFGIFADETTDTCLYFGDLDEALEPLSGQPVQFDPGSLVISED